MSDLLTYLRKEKPLVHCITNYVTANDVANTVLGIGASVIMADAKEETAEITGIAKALVLNLGTPDRERIAAKLEAGKAANAGGIPVVLDPVGVGASAFRNQAVRELLAQIAVTVIRGNLSELSYLTGMGHASKGVDMAEENAGNDAALVAKQVAEKYNCIGIVSGKTDVITDGKRFLYIQNGTPRMSAITGAGCMADGILGAFLAARRAQTGSAKPISGEISEYWDACAEAVAVMGIAGEIAEKRCRTTGTGSFRVALIDAVSQMDEKQIAELTRYTKQYRQ